MGVTVANFRKVGNCHCPDSLPLLEYRYELLLTVQEIAPVFFYTDFIVRDLRICGGEAVIKGTRVPVRTILASLAEGATVEQILADFPTLADRDVRAVIAFAAASAVEDLPVGRTPVPA